MVLDVFEAAGLRQSAEHGGNFGFWRAHGLNLGPLENDSASPAVNLTFEFSGARLFARPLERFVSGIFTQAWRPLRQRDQPEP